MAQGGSANMMDFVNIPVSIALGVALGAAVGLMLHLFLETAYRHGCYVRNSTKVILILGLSFLLMAVGAWAQRHRVRVRTAGRYEHGRACSRSKVRRKSPNVCPLFGKLWIAAEAILFVLVGAAVDIRCAVQAGAAAVLMIASCARVPRGRREHLYARYRAEPKGAPVLCYCLSAEGNRAGGHRPVPLSMGLPCGQLVLSVAVLAILITAPLGAIGIDRTAGRLLCRESPSDIAE